MDIHIIIFTFLFKFSLCRDYYVGMFKKNDLLVAQDTVYKERNHFGFTTAKYGRVFNCPITYFRVSDRLGAGRPPAVTVTRGGLQKRYLTLLLTSSYNTPIAVNIYIGCENKLTTTTKATTEAEKVTEANADATGADGENPTGGDEVAETGADEAPTGDGQDTAATNADPAPPDNGGGGGDERRRKF